LDPNSRDSVDFYVDDKQWCIELLVEGKRLTEHENRFKINWDMVRGFYTQIVGSYFNFHPKQYVVCDFRPLSRTKNIPQNVDKSTCFVVYDDENFVGGKFIQNLVNGTQDQTDFKFVANVDIYYESV